MLPKERVRLHLCPTDPERRRSNRTPFNLTHDLKLVLHIHRIRVRDNLVDRRRRLADGLEWVRRLVEHLTGVVGEHGVAHRFGGEGEAHGAGCEVGIRIVVEWSPLGAVGLLSTLCRATTSS